MPCYLIAYDRNPLVQHITEEQSHNLDQLSRKFQSFLTDEFSDHKTLYLINTTYLVRYPAISQLQEALKSKFSNIAREFGIASICEIKLWVSKFNVDEFLYGNDNDNVRQWYNNPEFRNEFCEFIGTISSQSDLD